MTAFARLWEKDVRDSDFLIGTPYRVGGRTPGCDGGVDCYGVPLLMAKVRGLTLRDEMATHREAWFSDSAAAAADVAPEWVQVPPPFQTDDILILPADSGAPTHMGYVDDPWFVIQASRFGVWRVPVEQVRPIRIYRHVSRCTPNV